MEPVTIRRWSERGSEPDPALPAALVETLRLPALVARLLARRGITSVSSAREFLDCRLGSLPDPFLLPGMDRAANRLARAVTGGERIAVHGDYDVDGITGAALLVETLRGLGASVDCHIPLRLRDGYGLSAEALRQAAAAGAGVAVSVDCGVCAVAEAQLARELGLDLIVTDHHQPPEQLPEAYAIVNPHLPCDFPFKPLAGVGVAFFLLVALRKLLRESGFFHARPEPDLRHGLDLVALGTIADIVPLTSVNRTLTKAGLALLSGGERPGVGALRDVAGLLEVTCGNVAFQMAPRLNAAGRLEDALLGVDLLLQPSVERALAIARLLDDFNRERQQIERQTLEQAIERLERGGEGGDHSIVLADERWHPGVIGIVASRLVERYHRPTVLIALENDQGRASARSIPGFHLYRALHLCQEHLSAFGGHEFAAGASLGANAVSGFALAFERAAASALRPEDLIPSMGHDGDVLLEELTYDAVRSLAELSPFGAGNPEAVFLLRGVRAQQVSVVGERHLRFTLRQGGYSLPGIAFGAAMRRSELEGEFDALATPGLNEWRGRVSVQLRLKDFRPVCRPNGL